MVLPTLTTLVFEVNVFCATVNSGKASVTEELEASTACEMIVFSVPKLDTPPTSKPCCVLICDCFD